MDSSMIEMVYRKYANEAYLYSLALCRNRNIAEDIVSEAFLKALTSMSAQEEHFKLWLFKVCKSIWIDMCRHNRYVSDQPIDDLYDLQSGENVLHDLIRQEEGKKVVSAILKLPDICREAVTLFYFNNVPQTTIAEMLGLTHGAVRTLIYRGRKLLAVSLKEAHDEL